MRHISAKSCNSSPIFIVGVPRSGTTLMAAMIGAHSNISCGTETDFFHFFEQIDPDELYVGGNWPNKAIDYLFSMIQAKGKSPVPVNYSVTRDDLRRRLEQEPPNQASIVKAVTEHFMLTQGKQRWAEKTPRHIFYLHKIRRTFPDAKILKVIRDPRDTALSIVKAPWAWAPRDFVSALAMWRFCDDASIDFIQRDTNTLCVKYEDLVCHPSETLNTVCGFIGEKFESDMLSPKKSYTQVNSINEPWKQMVAKDLDVSRTSVWKRELDKDQQSLALTFIGDKLMAYGYEANITGLAYHQPVPKHGYLYFDEWQNIPKLMNMRFWPDSNNHGKHNHIYFGYPEENGWLGHNNMSRLNNFAAILYQIFAGKLTKNRSFWIKPPPNRVEGFLSKVICQVLEKFATIVPATHPKQNAEQWIKNLLHNPRIGQFQSDKSQTA